MSKTTDVQAIIIRYSGNASRDAFNLSIDGNHFQVAVMKPGKEEPEIIFTGKQFSPEKYEKLGGKKQEERHLGQCRER